MEQQNFNEAELQEAQELAEDHVLEDDSSFDNWYEHEKDQDNLDDFMDIDSRNVLFFN